jgi:succinoglycan biosynthesis transport protein ExoP
VDFRRLTVVFSAWLRVMLVAAVLAGGTAYFVSTLQRPTYEAKAKLIVGRALTDVDPDPNQLSVGLDLASTYATIAETRPVLQRVIDSVGLGGTPGELLARLTIDTPRETALLTIAARHEDPAMAARIANAMASELIASAPSVQSGATEFQKSIQADLEATLDLIESTQERARALIAIPDRTESQEADLQAAEDRLATLRSTYVALLGYSSSDGNVLSVIEPAVAPERPVAPLPLLNALLAAALALFVVFALAFLVEQLDDSIKDSDAVRAVTGLNTLASVERMKGDPSTNRIYRVATLVHPGSSAAEAYRTLRSSIEFTSLDDPCRSLLVTSSAPGEGKSVTAANLAVVYAQTGRKVLLVDADLRKGTLHELFQVPNASGLTTLFRNPSTPLDEVAQATQDPFLRVVTPGPRPPNPAELVGSQRMKAILELLEGAADIVIFDSPPVQTVTDAALLSSIVDGTLLVVDAHRGRRRLVRGAAETLERARANVLGVVLNGVRADENNDYSSYYASPDEPSPEGVAPSRRGRTGDADKSVGPTETV